MIEGEVSYKPYRTVSLDSADATLHTALKFYHILVDISRWLHDIKRSVVSKSRGLKGEYLYRVWTFKILFYSSYSEKCVLTKLKHDHWPDHTSRPVAAEKCQKSKNADTRVSSFPIRIPMSHHSTVSSIARFPIILETDEFTLNLINKK